MTHRIEKYNLIQNEKGHIFLVDEGFHRQLLALAENGARKHSPYKFYTVSHLSLRFIVLIKTIYENCATIFASSVNEILNN